MSDLILVNRESFEIAHGSVSGHIVELRRLRDVIARIGLDIFRAWESESSTSFFNVDWSNQQLLVALIYELERLNEDMLVVKETFEERDAHESTYFRR